jgi:hypothetical protein
MKDGSIRSTGTPFGLPTATPFGWLSVASADRLGCEISPYNIRALELEDNVRLPNGNFTVRLVTEDRRAGFNNLHVFGANVACLIGSAQFQGDPAFVELANSGSDADDRSEADNATLRPADRLACVGGDEMTPSTPSTILARPGMCPRKRGPKPVRLEKTRAAMRFKLKADSTYREELEKAREKELAATYGVSRDTARKARKAVLSEFAENSDRDK